LPRVKVPVLFIVGGEDAVVLELNRKAMTHVPGERKLKIVPGATHLFEEPGKLEEVAKISTEWFSTHLS
jgi:pimeloyl-ACP methyl ester carboxylesterase